MYLMYVDESGDPGLVNSPSKFFCLSGLVIHERSWRPALDQLIDFRSQMKARFGLRLREEIHAADLIAKPGDLSRIRKHDRLTILRNFIDTIEGLPEISIINVVVDKSHVGASIDPFQIAWTTLVQRFENTITNQNFPGPRLGSESGIIIPDQTDTKKLTELVRRMRRFNPIPNQSSMGSGYRQMALHTIIEDPWFKSSESSFFIQAADCVCYMLYQKHAPNRYIKKQTGSGYFHRLNNSLCRVASNQHPQGIVYR